MKAEVKIVEELESDKEHCEMCPLDTTQLQHSIRGVVTYRRPIQGQAS